MSDVERIREELLVVATGVYRAQASVASAKTQPGRSARAAWSGFAGIAANMSRVPDGNALGGDPLREGKLRVKDPAGDHEATLTPIEWLA